MYPQIWMHFRSIWEYRPLGKPCPVKTDEFSEAFNPPPLVWQTILWIFGDWSRVAFFLFQKIICFDMLPNIVDG